MKKIIILVSVSIIFLFSCNSTKKINTRSFYLPEIDIDTTLIGKRFSGNISLNDNTKNDDKPLRVEILYLTNGRPNYVFSKEIYRKKTYNFDFIISNEDLKEYTLISFSKGTYDTIFPIKNLKKEGNSVILNKKNYILAKKPVIYLYPRKKTDITITHVFKGRILSTYPKYTNNWDITAFPNGQIYNKKDKRIYNYLFWEGEMSFPDEHYNYDSGFIVEKEKVIVFLQHKLEQIGLNNNEINDFISYWIPELSKQKYYFIHFRINDNIDNTSFLKIEPNPETIIRVFMEYKGLDNIDNIIKVKKQKLKNIKRKGYTIIEWGGAKINRDILTKNNS